MSTILVSAGKFLEYKVRDPVRAGYNNNPFIVIPCHGKQHHEDVSKKPFSFALFFASPNVVGRI